MSVVKVFEIYWRNSFKTCGVVALTFLRKAAGKQWKPDCFQTSWKLSQNRICACREITDWYGISSLSYGSVWTEL